MQKLFLVEVGTGIDQHGQDVTTAALRAVEAAIRPVAMPGLKALLPGGDYRNMRIEVRLAVPCDRDKLDLERVRRAFPYGSVEIEVVDGGMTAGSGTLLPEKGDRNDLIYVVNAAVRVGC
ncbi:MAG TPA: Lin0512 family protein [Pelomicrobium sp.]|nr:Lin0512 family protein [Pelomicrobium sp.]